MIEKAVIDRIIDGNTAVILVGDDERKLHYPADKLPAGTEEGFWLRVQVESGEIISLEVDREETEIVRGRIQKKIDALRKRGEG
jgi:hypothetical protein